MKIDSLRTSGLCVLFLLIPVISACTSNGDDLRDWVNQQKKTIKPSVKPLEEPKDFTPASYAGVGSLDPFDSQKLTRALLPQGEVKGNDLILAQEKRRREPLEAYPLDSMSMVGTLHANKGLIALVRVDNLLYQVSQGNYLGQNYGLVQNIDEQGVLLREIVQDAAGEWIERTATLELQEK